MNDFEQSVYAMTLKWLLPVWCWAIYPVLFLYSRNRGLCTADDLWRPLTVALVVASVLWALLSATLHSRARGSLGSCALLLLFFAYGHIEGALAPYEFALGPWIVGPNKVLIPAYFLTLAALSWWLVSERRTQNELLRTVTVIGASLSVMALIPGLHPANAHTPGNLEHLREISLQAPAQDSSLPPIYLIVLDAYAGKPVLRDQYGFDNSSFLTSLRDRGFFVARESRSNYPQSILSLPSMLNFSYLRTLLPGVDEDERSRQPLQKILRYNQLFASLQPLGYQTITFDAAGWDVLNIPNSDVFYDTPGMQLNALENELVNTSLAGFLSRFLTSDRAESRAAFHRRRINYAFERLGSIGDREGPFIAYAHIGCPHQPFVFDSTGDPIPQDSDRFSTWFTGNQVPDQEEYRRGYLGQLQYMNQRVDDLIDRLLATDRPRPIIMLVSDHGPAMDLHTESADQTNFRERFSNLVAVYFPDQDYSELYETISLVNLIRVVLNEQFDASLKLLPDQQYYASWSRPYRMIQVP